MRTKESENERERERRRVRTKESESERDRERDLLEWGQVKTKTIRNFIPRGGGETQKEISPDQKGYMGREKGKEKNKSIKKCRWEGSKTKTKKSII